MLCLGDVLVSLCDEGHLKTWNVKKRRNKPTGEGRASHVSVRDEERVREDSSKRGKEDSGGDFEEEGDGALCHAALEGGFVPTALAHPPTYLNKVVVGSEAGALQLWNVRTGRCCSCPCSCTCGTVALANSHQFLYRLDVSSAFYFLFIITHMGRGCVTRAGG